MKEIVEEYGGAVVIFLVGLGFIIGLSFIANCLHGQGSEITEAVHAHWSMIF